MFNLDSFLQKNSTAPILLPLQDAEIFYYPSFFSELKANGYFQQLRSEIPWQQDKITVFGKQFQQPRLTSLHGKEGKTYTYSGITMHPKPFTKVLSEILSKIETVCKENFTTVLLNLYRSGNDSNGWHSDNEKELGKNPIIASVSFGTVRFFHLKHREDPKLTYKLSLAHGSLLVMQGTTQHFWLHQIPKSKKISEERINLTFRRIV